MNIKLIIKGFIVGLGKIIPGVSGSVLAMTLGIYNQLIEAITHFLDNVKEHFKFLFFFFLGVGLAIILGSKLLLYFLNRHYGLTMYLFLGLIIGTLVPFIKSLKFSKKNIMIFLIASSIMIVFSGVQGNIIRMPFNSFNIVLCGFIDALTSIVPGISGTLIFMLLGVYDDILNLLANPIQISLTFYGIGMAIGIIITCYIMNYLLKHYKFETYSAISAFMVISIIVLMFNLKGYLNIFSFLFFLIGLLLAFILEK